MSDPAWASSPLIDGPQGIAYVQAAGVTAAPGTADEIGAVTAFTVSNKNDVKTSSAYLNYATKKKSTGGTEATGSLSIDVLSGAHTTRNTLIAANTAKTRVKITVWIGSTSTGEKHVLDQCLVDFQGDLNTGEKTTYKFDLAADSYAHTSASA